MKKNYRYERKYMLTNSTAYILKQRLSCFMELDQNNSEGPYRVSSLYFDDIYNSSFYEKLNGVVVRDKFRVRHYNGNMDKLRLELKHKRDTMLCKEGHFITQEQYESMRRRDFGFMYGVPINVFERFYLVHVLRQMRPVVLVEYDRYAYVQRAGNIRVTFDSNIKASHPNSKYSRDVEVKKTIIEIKYDQFLPQLVLDALQGVTFTQQLALSKFTMAKQVVGHDRGCLLF